MTASRGIGRGGTRPGAGRKPKLRALAPIAAAQDLGLQVEQMAAIGELPETIAQGFAVTVGELRRQCADALDHGPARRRRELVGLMFEAARAGSVPALLWLVKRTEAVAAERPMREPQPVLLGKKAQAVETARRSASGGGRFAPPPPPKLVVDNS